MDGRPNRRNKAAFQIPLRWCERGLSFMGGGEGRANSSTPFLSCTNIVVLPHCFILSTERNSKQTPTRCLLHQNGTLAQYLQRNRR